MSSNKFSDALPASVFLLPSLQVFAAAANCFGGSQLPVAEMCKAKGLTTLILDGLSSGCRTPIWGPNNFAGFSGTVSAHDLDGTFPSCLMMDLPSISTLQVSGLGLRGHLPNLQQWPPHLQALGISHNRLTGPFFPTLQPKMSQLSRVDASYNKLSGEISSLSVPNASLNLIVNRFSGLLSSSIIDSKKPMSILESNLFDCSADNTNLPQHDPYLLRFQCGSLALNKYLWAFVAILIPTFFLYWCVARCWPQLDLSVALAPVCFRALAAWIVPRGSPAQARPLSLALNPCTSPENSITIFRRVLALVRIFSLHLLVILSIFLLPIYGGLSVTSGTHSDVSLWTVTAGFKSGDAAAAVLIFCLAIILPLYSFQASVLFASERMPEDAGDGFKKIDDENKDDCKLSTRDRAVLLLRLLTVMLINAVVVLGANVGYVKFNTLGSVHQQIAVKLALSLFKLFWNSSALQSLMRAPILFFGVPGLEVRSQSTVHALRGGILFQLAMLAFNNILAPFIASATTDARCFKSAFYSPPLVVATYDETRAVLQSAYFGEYRAGSGLYLPDMARSFILHTPTQQSMSSFFSPPFIYTYQCSSSLLQSYVPVFVLVGTISTFATPCKYFVVRALLDAVFPPTSVDASTDPAPAPAPAPVPPLSLAHRLLLSQLPKLLWRAHERSGYVLSTTPSIDAHRFFLETLADLCLVCTFGIAAPLLLLVSCCSLWARSWRLEFIINNFLPQGAEGDSEEQRDVARVLRGGNHVYNTRLFFAIFPPFFFVIFCVDFAGDERGALAGIWAPLVMLVLPASLVLLSQHALPSSVGRCVIGLTHSCLRALYAADSTAFPLQNLAGKRDDSLAPGSMEIEITSVVDDIPGGWSEGESRGSRISRSQGSIVPGVDNPMISSGSRGRSLRLEVEG